MTQNKRGTDKPDDFKRFSNIDKEYNFSKGQVGNAIPQSEQKSTKK